MKVYRKLVLVLALVLSAAMATSGTIAYLSDVDSETNTMTLGKVEIEQTEQEWKDAAHTELQGFAQDKPLYPTAGEAKTLSDHSTHPWLMDATSVVDKYVSVTNTGKSDAYVRTIFAFEAGSYTSFKDFQNVIGTTYNTKDWEWSTPRVVNFNGQNYIVAIALYEGSDSEDKNLLKRGKTTNPSLYQVYMTSTSDNKEVKAIDGNGNGDYEILVLSQAIQADGFDNAAAAFKSGFDQEKDKPSDALLISWFTGEEFDYELVNTSAELAAALAKGGTVKLTADITTDLIEIKAGTTATLDLNGKNLTATKQSEEKTNYAIHNYGTLTLTGNGTITARGVQNLGTMTVEDGVKIFAKDTNGGSCIWNEGVALTINGGIFTTAENATQTTALYNNKGTVTINGGTFEGKASLAYAVINNADTMTINKGNFTGTHGVVAVDNGTATITGGTFHLIGIKDQSDHCIYAEPAGAVNITGGEFTAVEETGLDAGGQIFYGSTITDNRQP